MLHAARVEALIGSVVEGGVDGGPAGAANWVQVISAFDVPKILYDPIRKSFYRAPQPTSLLGTAEVGTIGVPVIRSWLHAGSQQDTDAVHHALGTLWTRRCMRPAVMLARLRACWPADSHASLLITVGSVPAECSLVTQAVLLVAGQNGPVHQPLLHAAPAS